MNKDQAAQQLFRLYQDASIFDKDIQLALNIAILELKGQSGELPQKVKEVLNKIGVETNRMMQAHKGQMVLNEEE